MSSSSSSTSVPRPEKGKSSLDLFLNLPTLDIKKHTWDVYLEELKTKGYTVIPHVLTPEESTQYKSRAWTWLENLGTHIDRTKPETWNVPQWPFTQHGILAYPSVSHANFIWDLRTHPSVVDIFQRIWKLKDPEELLVGFCRASILLPAHAKQDAMAIKDWSHVDQSSSKPHFACVQGCVNLSDQLEEKKSAGFMCVPYSHLQHASFFKATGKKSDADWYRHTPEDLEFFRANDPRCVSQFVPVSEGSLTLWDSRTIHFNRGFSVDPDAFSTATLRDPYAARIGIFVSMAPRAHATPTILQKKRKAFEERLSTNHWPTGCKKFPKIPFVKPRAQRDHIEAWTQVLSDPTRPLNPEEQLVPTRLIKKLCGYV